VLEHTLLIAFIVRTMMPRALQQTGNFFASGFMTALGKHNHGIANHPANFIVIVFIQDIAFHFSSVH